MMLPHPKFNLFERVFLEKYLIELGIEAEFEEEALVLPTCGDTFARVILLNALVALDLANERIDSLSGHGREVVEYLARLTGTNNVEEVVSATRHVVAPVVDRIIDGWLCKPIMADMISEFACRVDTNLRKT